MAVLLPWGVLMRRNSAAHRRVLILATICISDAGFSRFVSLFLPAPTGFLGTYLFYEGGNVLLMLLMFLWDWKRNRIMKQFLWEPCSSPLWACRPRASTSTRLGNRSPAHGWRAGRGTCCKAGRLRVGAWPLTSAQSFKVKAPCPPKLRNALNWELGDGTGSLLNRVDPTLYSEVNFLSPQCPPPMDQTEIIQAIDAEIARLKQPQTLLAGS